MFGPVAGGWWPVAGSCQAGGSRTGPNGNEVLNIVTVKRREFTSPVCVKATTSRPQCSSVSTLPSKRRLNVTSALELEFSPIVEAREAHTAAHRRTQPGDAGHCSQHKEKRGWQSVLKPALDFDLKSSSLTRPLGWQCQCSRRSAHHLATPCEVQGGKLDPYFKHFPTLVYVQLPALSEQVRTLSKVAGEWTQVVTLHQELTADLPRLAASLHSIALLPPLSSHRWCESSGRQSRTISLPRHRHDRRTEAHNHFGTELRPSARPPSAAPRPVTANRSSHCPLEGDPPQRGQFEGQVWGQCRAVRLGWPASGRFLGQIAVGIPEQQEEEEEEEEESRPFQRRSPGDASVNARAMSRRKQGNPQHLSQREITQIEHPDGSLLSDSLLSQSLGPPPRTLEPSLAHALPPGLHADHDLLTCGQCQLTFPLGDILLFIEHKKKQCQMPPLANGCYDKMSDRGGGSPTLQGLHHHGQRVELRKVLEPVEIGIQVTPEEEKEEEEVGGRGRGGQGGERRERTPIKGICPKQENALAASWTQTRHLEQKQVRHGGWTRERERERERGMGVLERHMATQ
ncbi:unnamed protein product, partial [Pleuronectes platessa]